MDPLREKRKFPRYTVPVLVEVPALSDFPLVPEDISGGGIRIVVSREPVMDQVVECSLQINDHSYSSKGKVVWLSENDTDPPTWTAGLSVMVHEELSRELNAHLKESVLELGAEAESLQRGGREG